MPFHPERYPKNWKAISLRIRKRAQDRCEFCGAKNHKPHPISGSLVVLTVAHLDHQPMNCDDGNLKALCQRCHLRYDAKHHSRSAALTRRLRLLARGQMEMKI